MKFSQTLFAQIVIITSSFFVIYCYIAGIHVYESHRFNYLNAMRYGIEHAHDGRKGLEFYMDYLHAVQLNDIELIQSDEGMYPKYLYIQALTRIIGVPVYFDEMIVEEPNEVIH